MFYTRDRRHPEVAGGYDLGAQRASPTIRNSAATSAADLVLDAEPMTSSPVRALLAASPAPLAPMEDVSAAVFRRVCRGLGAQLCVTEFIRAEQLIARAPRARHKATLAADDRPTAIQIYGADATL